MLVLAPARFVYASGQRQSRSLHDDASFTTDIRHLSSDKSTTTSILARAHRQLRVQHRIAHSSALDSPYRLAPTSATGCWHARRIARAHIAPTRHDLIQRRNTSHSREQSWTLRYEVRFSFFRLVCLRSSGGGRVGLGAAQVRTLGHMATARMRTLSDTHADDDTSLLAHDHRRRHHEPYLLH